MVTFVHMAWWQEPIKGTKKSYSTMKEKERLELDLTSFEEIMTKADELSKSGWYEVHIHAGEFHVIYDYMWRD